MGNFRHVNVENTFIELVNEIPYGNQDGFHFWGPGQFLTMRNIGGKSEDDFMNIGPDERDGVSSITDVLIDGVFLDHAWQGIRLLSRGTGLLDRVTIRNVTGTYSCFGFYVNPCVIDKTMGNFGNITFENIDLRPEQNENIGEEYLSVHPPFLFSIGGDMENLTFRNIMWYHPDCNWNIFQIGYPFHNTVMPYERAPRIRNMLIDGLQILESDQAQPADYMILRGQVDRLTLRDVQVLRSKAGSKLLNLKPDGHVDRLTLDRVDAENLDCLVDISDGSINRVVLNHVLTQNVAAPIRGNTQVLGQVTKL